MITILSSSCNIRACKPSNLKVLRFFARSVLRQWRGSSHEPTGTARPWRAHWQCAVPSLPRRQAAPLGTVARADLTAPGPGPKCRLIRAQAEDHATGCQRAPGGRAPCYSTRPP